MGVFRIDVININKLILSSILKNNGWNNIK